MLDKIIIRNLEIVTIEYKMRKNHPTIFEHISRRLVDALLN